MSKQMNNLPSRDELTSAVGSTVVEFSRMEYWVAYSIHFLTSDFYDQTPEQRYEAVFNLNLRDFSRRATNLSNAVEKAKFPQGFERMWKDAIRALEKINLYRTDLQHGMWRSGEAGVGVDRLRRGTEQELSFHSWSIERLTIFTEAILWAGTLLLSLLGSSLVHEFRASRQWKPDKPAEDALMILWAKTDSDYLWKKISELESERFDS